MDDGKMLNFNLHKAACRLESDHLPFLEYAGSYLVDLEGDPLGEPQVSTWLHWDQQPPDEWRKGSTLQLGRRVYSSGQAFLQTENEFLPGLQLVVQQEGDQLFLDAFYQPPSRRMRMLQQLNIGQDRVYAILLYYLVYFPLVVTLQRQRGLYLLHAGGAVRPGNDIVLAGLPGSGKSTFTLALLQDAETYLLSENLLLADEDHVYALPEPLHLSRQSLALLPEKVRESVAFDGRRYSHQRWDFRLLPERRAWQARPDSLYFLSVGKRLQHSPISCQQAVTRLLAYDAMAKELNAYRQFAAFIELALFPGGGGLLGGKRAVLEKLLSGVQCWELQLERGAGLSLAVDLVKDNSVLQTIGGGP